MAKRIIVHITSDRGRQNTLLAEVPRKAERSTQDNFDGGGLTGGSFGGLCADNCSPQCEVYRIVDIRNEIIDSFFDRWGEVVDGNLVSDAGASSAITVQAKATRIDGNTFVLPSDAAWIVDVWIDGLHADPNFHYTFTERRTINTVYSLPADAQVSAVYFNLAV